MSTDDPVYRVGKVAELTGLSTHVLRVWERRYGAVVPRRTEKGGRLYSEADVSRLARLASLARAGYAIGTIATLSDEELVRMSSEAVEVRHALDTGEIDALADRFLGAIERFDELEAERSLARVALALEPRDLVVGFFGRVLREVGDRWESGAMRIAHEHLVSALVRELLASVRRLYGSATDAPRAVVSTVRGELHEFGALMAAVLAGMHGHRVLYLGADLPAAEIVHAARCVRADLLLLSIPSDEGGHARAELEAIVEGLADLDGEIVFGGEAASAFSIEGARFVEDFTALERDLAGARRRPGRRAR
jgi:MerR family transcriptional regulator, light-induced transcriptional regulator